MATPLYRPATLLLALACSSTSTEPSVDCNALAVAASSARVDLAPPVFSNPLAVTNPLFPISRLHSTVLLGTVDGQSFRTETTLMPATVPITVNGRTIQTNESQYVAWLGGRLHEVALDWYAQADDGSVWYLGEDVFNFEDGVIADREGTWRAGRDGTAAMIMPASPRVGDVFRPENSCPIVFEEVTVKSIGITVAGPSGPVPGSIVVSELHMDGSREDKTFAPGYGEFSTSSGGDIEALALAVPTDARSGPEPVAVASLINGGLQVLDAASAGNWTTAATALATANSAWSGYRAAAPPLVATAITNALASLDRAVTSRQAVNARIAAIEAARAALDLRLMHRPVAEVNRTRLDLWAAEAVVDAAAGNVGFVRGDVASAEYVWARIATSAPPTLRAQVEGSLREMRTAADTRNLALVAAAAGRLRAALQPN
jgi:hypothetical protein